MYYIEWSGFCCDLNDRFYRSYQFDSFVEAVAAFHSLADPEGSDGATYASMWTAVPSHAATGEVSWVDDERGPSRRTRMRRVDPSGNPETTRLPRAALLAGWGKRLATEVVTWDEVMDLACTLSDVAAMFIENRDAELRAARDRREAFLALCERAYVRENLNEVLV